MPQFRRQPLCRSFSFNQEGLRGRARQYFHPGPTQSTNIAVNQRRSIEVDFPLHEVGEAREILKRLALDPRDCFPEQD